MPLQDKKLLTLNLILFVAMCTNIFSFVFFNTSLNYEGSRSVFHTIFYNSFYFFEPSRWVFHILQQIFSLLFIKFSDSNSLSTLTHLFSFGLVWIHLISIFGCYLILPKHKKHFLFFPLVAFFMGSLTALGISISAALSVCSYIWLVAFIIYYSNLNSKIHKFWFVFTPLTLLFAHEMMSYMAWPLIYLCVLKFKQETNKSNQLLISIMIAFFTLVSILTLFFLLTLTVGQKNNLDFFKYSLFNFKFLFSNSNFNLIIFCSLLLKLSLLIEFFSKKKSYLNLSLFLLLILLIISFVFILFAPINQFTYYQNPLLMKDWHIRVWPPVFSLPFGLLIWYLYEIKKISRNISKRFMFLCIVACMSITIYRIKSDIKFEKIRKEFSSYLDKCEGVINFSDVTNYFSNINDFHKIKKEVWAITSISLIYPQNKSIKTIIVNDNCLSHCINSIEKKDFSSKKACSTSCDHNLTKIKNIILQNNSNSLLKRFFNFKPLYNNFIKQKAFCNQN